MARVGNKSCQAIVVEGVERAPVAWGVFGAEHVLYAAVQRRVLAAIIARTRRALGRTARVAPIYRGSYDRNLDGPPEPRDETEERPS